MRGLPEESGDLLPPGGEVPGVPKGGERVCRSDEGVVSVEISRGASGVIAVDQHLFEQGRGDDGAHARGRRRTRVAAPAATLASPRRLAVLRCATAPAKLAAAQVAGAQRALGLPAALLTRCEVPGQGAQAKAQQKEGERTHCTRGEGNLSCSLYRGRVRSGEREGERDRRGREGGRGRGSDKT